MPKQADAGPSKPSTYKKPYNPDVKKGVKTIPKTADLIKRDERIHGKGKGKGKEKESSDIPGKVLPPAIQVERFAEVRAFEIQAFQNAIKSAAFQGATRTFQSLPRHLRRRAASHNPRRVPLRMRAKAAAEIDPGDDIAKSHRKKAKRRAMGSLRGLTRTQDFLHRQRNKTWLQTHLYHSRRFHMINIFSHRLPLTPTLKSFRPAYRASKTRCTVHDVGYFGIIELEGTREGLISGLGKVLVGRFGGGKFAEVLVYEEGEFPRGLIGPVEVLWKGEEMDDGRRLWLRIHPSIFEQVLGALSGVLERYKLEMRDLRGEIDGFELVGPLAGKVLKRVLKLCRSEISEKAEFYDSLAVNDGPSQSPDGLVVGLRVHDPRLSFPPRHLSSTQPRVAESGILRSTYSIQPSTLLASSDIWSKEARSALGKPLKKSELDHRRRKLPIPGTRLHPLPTDPRMPTLILTKHSPLPSYTLLFPRGWSQPILESILYTRTMLVGLRERRFQHKEAGVPCFPEHWPGVCEAGKEFEQVRGDEEKRRWDRRPRGKRVEWGKVGTEWPFGGGWAGILNGDDDEERQINSTGTDQDALPWLTTKPLTPYIDGLDSSRLLSVVNAFRKERGLDVLPSSQARRLWDTALVHVRVEMLGRGSPGDNAIIYALDEGERSKWVEAQEKEVSLGRAGYAGSSFPLEPITSEIQTIGEVIPDRKTVTGFTSTGNFSMERGTGHGMGSVTLKSYVECLRVARLEGRDGRVLVKVKNKDGRLCRLAELVLVL